MHRNWLLCRLYVDLSGKQPFGKSAIVSNPLSWLAISRSSLFQTHYRGQQSAARQLAFWQSAKAISHRFKSTIVAVGFKWSKWPSYWKIHYQLLMVVGFKWLKWPSYRFKSTIVVVGFKWLKWPSYWKIHYQLLMVIGFKWLKWPSYCFKYTSSWSASAIKELFPLLLNAFIDPDWAISGRLHFKCPWHIHSKTSPSLSYLFQTSWDDIWFWNRHPPWTPIGFIGQRLI